MKQHHSELDHLIATLEEKETLQRQDIEKCLRYRKCRWTLSAVELIYPWIVFIAGNQIGDVS
jgi:predicted anti-sigma-YlaC factor YlaD